MKNRKLIRLMCALLSVLMMVGMILAAVVLSTVALITLRASIEDNRGKYEAMRQYAMTLEGDNQDLDQRIQELGSIESALRIAMEELGLVLPDSVVITPGN